MLSNHSVSLAILVLVCCGCAGPASSDRDGPQADEHDHDHDHHHHDVDRPPHLPAAVAELRRTVRLAKSETASGHAGHAREEWERLTELAQWLPWIAADSDLPKAEWDQVAKWAETLGEIGSREMDGEQDAPRLDEIVAELEALVATGTWWNRELSGASPTETETEPKTEPNTETEAESETEPEMTDG